MSNNKKNHAPASGGDQLQTYTRESRSPEDGPMVPVTMRLPTALVDALKRIASEHRSARGRYQALARRVLTDFVANQPK